MQAAEKMADDNKVWINKNNNRWIINCVWKNKKCTDRQSCSYNIYYKEYMENKNQLFWKVTY